ncbi:MAG: phosphoribosylanthranilate isomerase [Anaerolineae bacterium]|nr:phosphoribosylanthranilate isomerase [Anaerolineae bacterium]
MPVKVKICGITSFEDALAASAAGADLLGLNFYPKSPRYISPDDARELCAALRAELGLDCPTLVGLFVNEPVGKISVTMEKVGIRFVQLSGDESVEMLHELRGTAYKGIRPKNTDEAGDDARYFAPDFSEDERIPSLLIDAFHPDLYGGTGEQASYEAALNARLLTPRLMLAGGLKPENVTAAVEAVHPWGVDVASGVEIAGHPGQKDAVKMRDFVRAAKRVGVMN